MKCLGWFVVALSVIMLGPPALAQAARTESCLSKSGIATGILGIESSVHPNGTPIDAFILRLPAPTCAVIFVFGERSGDQRRNGMERIQLGPDNDTQRDRLRKLVGRTVSVRLKELVAPTTAWHVGDAVSTEFTIVGEGVAEGDGQSKAKTFLAQVKALPDDAVVFAIPAGKPFDDLLLGTPNPKSGSPAAQVANLRICESVSSLLSAQKKFEKGQVARWGSEIASSSRAWIAEQFRVPVRFVECSASERGNVDLAVVTGSIMKQMARDLDSKSQILDLASGQPRISFRLLSKSLEDFAIAAKRRGAGRTVDAQGLSDHQRNVTAAANRRQNAIDEQQRAEEEEARRIAQNVEDRRQLEKLKQQALSGDHDSAIKVVNHASAAGDRATAIQFQIIAANIGSSEEKTVVAERLLDGEGGFPRDPDRARKLLQQAVDAGYPPAMVKLASMESRLDGVRAENTKALDLFQRVLQSKDASAEAKQAAERNIDSLNKKIEENERHRAADIKLAKRIRDLGWLGRIELYPVKWNGQFEHYVEFARFSFTSKGLVLDVRDDLSDNRKSELKAAGITSYATPLQWKDDLCWETRQFQVGKEELPYQSFWTATVPNDGRSIVEVVTIGCVTRGQIDMRRDWLVETRSTSCGSFPRGPRGGCLLKAGRAEDREVVTFALGHAPEKMAGLQPAIPASPAPQARDLGRTLSQGDALRICGCIGRAEAASDFAYSSRAELAVRSSGQLSGPWVSVCERQRDQGRVDAVRSGAASTQWRNGYGPSCEDLLR